MIIAEPTKYGAGITLYGDYYDLRNTYEVAHSLSKGVPLDVTLGDFVLNFAYDVRKAYEGLREQKEFGFDDQAKVAYFGVNILWPIFIPQLALLRWAASFHSTTREQQGVLFMLEAQCEAALKNIDPKVGAENFDLMVHFGGLPSDYFTEYFYDVGRLYVAGHNNAKSRFKKLPRIIRSMQPGSEEYQIFKEFLLKEAEKKKCQPSTLSYAGEEPSFRW